MGSKMKPQRPASAKLNVMYKTALSLQSNGNLDGAIDLYKTILRLKPDSIESLCNLGGVLHYKDNYVEAIEYYQKALEIDARIPQIYYNLAGAQQALYQLESARKNYARALELKPDYLEVEFSIGLLDIQESLPSDALPHFQHILSLHPNNPDALNGIGICHKSLGDSTRALHYFQQALRVNPNHFMALGNLATQLLSLGEADESIRVCKHALSLNPDETKILFNLGLAHKQKKQFGEAAAYFRRVLSITPSAAYAQLELAHTLQSACDWTDDALSIHSTAKYIQELQDSDSCADVEIDLFNALSLPLKPDTLLRLAERKSNKLEKCSAQYRSHFDLDGFEQDARIRVGYLSPDYRNHPAIQLMGGLFNAHNRTHFEIFAYSIGPNDGSEYRRRAEVDAEHFSDLYNATLEQCIDRIRSDRIQILVDLAGYTTGARPEIFAARAAPVQVNYLGFAGSLGADFFDYIITDSIITPPSYQPYFREHFAYLPHCYQINDDRDKATGNISQRPAYGLPEGAFVYCCFNNNYKIDAEIFLTWSNILHQVPGSVLWLLKGSDLQMQNLRREATRNDLNPERIIFAEPVDKPTHLARHAHAELFLDTLYYNAHTTGSDALRQGVPMITCQGGTFASRVGSSLLHAVGLDDLIVTDLDQYSRKAVQLATNPKMLSGIRNKLIANLPKTSLLDNPRFAGSLEHLYKVMWDRFFKGESPRQIRIDDVD